MSKRTADRHGSDRPSPILAILALVWATLGGHAIDFKTVTLAWDPSPGPDVAGYRIYYTLTGGDTQVLDVGDVTTASVSELMAGETYSFYATCYNLAGLESEPSNSIEYTVPTSTPDNTAPVAEPLNLSTAYDTPLEVTLAGSDPEGDPLRFEIVTVPEHGSLTGLPPNLIYLPATDFAGPDGFTFLVRDGSLASDPATVSITVLPREEDPEPDPLPCIIGTVLVEEGTLITWRSIVGASYRVWNKDSLFDSGWSPLSDVIVAADTEMVYLDSVDVAVVPGRYYTVTRE